MTVTPPEPADLKRQMRADAKRRRAEAHRREGTTAGARLADAFDDAVEIPPSTVVSAYWPMGDELDVLPLITRLAGRGVPVCLPVVVAKDTPLIFRAWTPETALVPAGFGTSVPPPDAVERVPTLLLVPLLAWDRAGYRLGYGGGFYDRTLDLLRRSGAPTALGVAYSAQEVECVPRDANDQPLDGLLTEVGLIRFNTPGMKSGLERSS